MKYLPILFIAFYLMNSINKSNYEFGSLKKSVDFNEIKKEIFWFIEKVNPESIDSGEHNVYLVRMFENNNKKEFNVSITYIVDDLYLDKIEHFNEFIVLDGELVLIKNENITFSKYKLVNYEAEKLLDKKFIINKISKEGVVGFFEGYTVTYMYDKDGFRMIEKKYYENSDNIPEDKLIFEW